jgi:hypothetical protein
VVATFTTRLGLRKPDPTPVTGDLVDALLDLNNNFDKIDAALQNICTSSTRPSSPFVGMTAFETDTQAFIVCTAIGTIKWRYLSPKLVSPANEFVGQFRFTPSTNVLEVLDNSNTYQIVRNGLDIGGEWIASGSQAVNTGSNLLSFPTAIRFNGITWSGTVGTTVSSGWYNIFCQARLTVAMSAGICMGATTYADSTHILPFLGFTAGPDYGVSGPTWLNAGDTFSFWCYNNGSNTTTNYGLRPAKMKIVKTWGPK